MKFIQNFDLPIETTVLFICPNSEENSLEDLENKLKELGINFRESDDSNIDGAPEIDLSKNKELPQRKWNQLMNYLKKNQFRIVIESKFN
ncbi:hypothetical protein [uncultured Lacinutrix sp.]|uniref:hypothetical protein n=1 Tax=uncultured Lacinutrix sp. TaxID=574032 RepID=UPI002616F16E|nr:hypothetical protein [uncultured Lacinutrix sp.]